MDMPRAYPADAGRVVFSVDGHAQFARRDPRNGIALKADGECITNAIDAVQFFPDVMH
jgi:hypothetical protein